MYISKNCLTNKSAVIGHNEIQSLCHEYRRLWSWSATAGQRLNDEEDESAQTKFSRLEEIEIMLLQMMSQQELVALRT